MCTIDQQTLDHVTGVSSAVSAAVSAIAIASGVALRFTGRWGVLGQAQCTRGALSDDLTNPFGRGIPWLDPRVDPQIEDLGQGSETVRRVLAAFRSPHDRNFFGRIRLDDLSHGSSSDGGCAKKQQFTGLHKGKNTQACR